MKLQGLVDTSTLVGSIPAEIIDNIDNYCSSTICRGELVQGLRVFRADPARQHVAGSREEPIRLLDSVPQFWRNFDAAASEGYGQLTAGTKSASRLKDALIAGHALALGVPVVTGDPGFARFNELEVLLPT